MAKFNFLKTVKKGVRSVNKFTKSKIGRVIQSTADKAIRGAISSNPAATLAYNQLATGSKLAGRALATKKKRKIR